MGQHHQVQRHDGGGPGPLAGIACGHAGQLGPHADAAGTQGGQQRHQPGSAYRGRAATQGHGDQEQQGAGAQPVRPVGEVGDRPGQDALLGAVSAEQAPVAAHRAFADALPGLVEGFDQVVAPAVLLGHVDEATDELGLVDAAGQGGFALASLAGPAGLTDQDVLRRKALAEVLADLAYMGKSLVDARRIIFPVGQQVDGEEVHRRRHLGMAQPELPHIGVGHWLLYPGFHFGDQLGQLGTGHFLAQQGLVTDDHRLDHVRVGVGGFHQGIDFLAGVQRVAVDPSAEHQLQSVLAGQLRYGLEAGHRIGAHAVEARRQQRQVGIHAFGPQDERLVERRLVLVEGAVGRALQLVGWRGGVRQDYRLALAVPEAGKRQQGDQRCEQVGKQGESAGWAHWMCRDWRQSAES